MELDDEDSRNGTGSKNVDKGFKDVDKRPIESIEPNREREPLFIL
jgi:hypothetical protein